MLNLVNKISLLLSIFLISCHFKRSDLLFKESSIKVVGRDKYYKVFNNAMDSLGMWKLNNLYGSNDTSYSTINLDSLICFNKKGNRIIGSFIIQNTGKNRNSKMDELSLLYGEIIEDKWYFFHGSIIMIPRSMVKDHDPSTPLSYEELHEIALKEVYAPYLKDNGEINEDWFISNFEGAGWGDFNDQEAIDWALKGKRFNNKKDFYEYSHKRAALGIWETRDTTQPIKHLEKHLP